MKIPIFLDKYNLAAAFRIQKINCNPSEILNKYNDSEIKYILLFLFYTTRSGITIIIHIVGDIFSKYGFMKQLYCFKLRKINFDQLLPTTFISGTYICI